jgi:hypothetical protein
MDVSFGTICTPAFGIRVRLLDLLPRIESTLLIAWNLAQLFLVNPSSIALFNLR